MHTLILMKKNDVNWEVTGLLHKVEGGNRTVLIRILERVDYSLFKHPQNYCVASTVVAVFRGLMSCVGDNGIVSYVGPKLDVDAIVMKLNDLYGSTIMSDLDSLLSGYPDTEKLTVDMVVSHFISRTLSDYDKYLQDTMSETFNILRSPEDDISTR